MSYSEQNFSPGQVLTASQMDQVEENIKTHQHGRGNVLSIWDNTTSANDITIDADDAGIAVFVSATKTVTITATSMASGWYAAVFNIGTGSEIVTITPSSGTIDGESSITLSAQQGCVIIANNDGGGIDFFTVGRGGEESTTIPQLAKDEDFTLTLDEAGKHLYHTSGSTHTYTIPANSSVAFPIGTVVTFVAGSGSGNVSIAITSDTLRLAGSSSTGTRTLAANGMATAIKVASTVWHINGVGIS